MDREKEEEHLRLIEITRDISNDTYEDRYREVGIERNTRIEENAGECTGREENTEAYPALPVDTGKCTGREENTGKCTGRDLYRRAYPVLPVYHLLAPHLPQPHPIWQETPESAGCSSVPEP